MNLGEKKNPKNRLTFTLTFPKTDADLDSEGQEIRILKSAKQQGHMTKSNSLTLAVAMATVATFSAKAQFIAYDNTSNYQGIVSSRGETEIGDEVSLIGGANVVTEFRFEYNFTGANDAGTGIVRFYDKTGAGGLAPGNLLMESSPFNLQNGFNQGVITGLNVAVPGTFIWTVDFDGIDGAETAGLLFYNGVTVGGDPGQSFDDHWENANESGAPNWVLGNNTDFGVVDNFGARVTVVPEPGTMALFALGAAALIARRRKA